MEKVFLFQHFRLLSLKMRPSYWSRFRKSHCMKGRSKNCKVKGNTFRLWSKTSAPHSSLPAAVPGFFTSIKKRAKYISPLTHSLFWCGSRRCRWMRNRVIRKTHNTWNSACVLCLPCIRPAQKASIIITPQRLELLFSMRDLWQSFVSSPAGTSWLQQDWDPGFLNIGSHLLPDQFSFHQFLI